MMIHKVLIDTDPGTDDAYALFYAAQHPQIDIQGISTIFGNVPTSMAAKNARFLMHKFNQSHVPVAMGAHKPYMNPELLCADFVHGKDGLGNTHEVEEIGENHHLPAPEFLVQKINEHSGRITLVAIAPLTNLAHALDLDPSIANKVKELVIMGGAIHCNGNINPATEANISNDAEAAQKVFNAGWPITLFPLDVTDHAIIPSESVSQYKQYGDIGRYLHAISLFYQDFYRQNRNGCDGQPVNGVVAHDLLPMVYLTDPGAFKFRTGGIHVIADHSILRGHMIMDDRDKWSHSHAWSHLPQVKVCFEVDYARVFNLFEAQLVAAAREQAARKQGVLA